MRYRKLGQFTVSEIGFGGWGIGGLTEGATSYGPTDDYVSKAAIRLALKQGINFFDTSNIYGDGHSEELIGEVMHQDNCRNKVIIATKGGFSRHLPKQTEIIDLSRQNLRKSLAGSLQRLKTDCVDLFQLHSPPIEIVNEEVVNTLQELKKEGLIKDFGFSLKSPLDGHKAIALGFKILQVNFSMIDQRAWDCELLDKAKKEGVSLIARTPFCFGFLTGKIKNLDFHPRDHRSSWPRAQLEKWLEAAKMFNEINEKDKRSLATLALKFCLFPETVATVIPGIHNPAEALENTAASNWPDLTQEEISQIRNIYKQNDFYIRAT